MIKYAILLFNLLGLFLYQLFFQANVNVTQSVPPSADAGSSFVVQVTINKADVSGFAKFQEDLPKGFTATAIDKSGATVLASDDAIKFIWASLPSDAAVKISFKITVDASVAGTQTLAGKFLYVVNNERQESDASSPVTINGTAPATAANNTPPANNTSTPPDTSQQTPVANTNTPTENNNTPSPVTTNTVITQPPAPAPSNTPVSITRSYSSSTVEPAGDITVSLTIHKGSLSGFAKMEESIPDGLVISDGDKQGASFTYVDNKVKFVWLSLPADSVFTISYKISVGSNVSGNQSISGEFSYLENNNAMKYEVGSTSFTVQGTSQPVASNNPAANTNQPENNTPPSNNTTQPAENTNTPPVNNATTEPVATQTQPETTTPDNNTAPVANSSQPATDTSHAATSTQPQAVPNENITSPANNTTQPVETQTANNAVTPNVPEASSSVNYRVQIMALHNPVSVSVLAKKYGITETINEEMLEGFTKYTVGRFNEYKTVRDHREEVRSKGVKGPFVVAYNSGKRITVQEALMITHQQWYK